MHLGAATSNACLNTWFKNGDRSPAALLEKDDAAKVKGLRHIAFQRPEAEGGPCGRTFEDAFMLANSAMFGIEGATPDDQARCAWTKVSKLKKSEFALRYANRRNRLGRARLHPRRIEMAGCRRCPRSYGCSRWLRSWNT